MRNYNKIFTVLLLSLAVSACASSSDDQRDKSREAWLMQNFVSVAASSDRFEIESSKLALQRSHNPDVRRIAQRLIKDHTQSSHELMAMLKNDGLPPPDKHMMHHHHRAMEELRKTGDFDHDYLAAQDVAHRQGIWLFRTYTERGENADLRDFAAKTLPVLSKHEHMIQKAEGVDNETSYQNTYEKREHDSNERYGR